MRDAAEGGRAIYMAECGEQRVVCVGRGPRREMTSTVGARSRSRKRVTRAWPCAVRASVVRAAAPHIYTYYIHHTCIKVKVVLSYT
jgi:hypothetical protein